MRIESLDEKQIMGYWAVNRDTHVLVKKTLDGLSDGPYTLMMIYRLRTSIHQLQYDIPEVVLLLAFDEDRGEWQQVKLSPMAQGALEAHARRGLIMPNRWFFLGIALKEDTPNDEDA